MMIIGQTNSIGWPASGSDRRIPHPPPLRSRPTVVSPDNLAKDMEAEK